MAIAPADALAEVRFATLLIDLLPDDEAAEDMATGRRRVREARR